MVLRSSPCRTSNCRKLLVVLQVINCLIESIQLSNQNFNLSDMSSTPTKTENMRRSFESHEMLILNESSPIGGEAALLQVREHVEEVDGGDELDDGVAQELEPLIVADLRLRLVRLPETRHNAEKKSGATERSVIRSVIRNQS